MNRGLAVALCVALASAACNKSSPSAPSSGGSTSGSVQQSGPQDPGPIDPATTGTISGVVNLEGWLKPEGDPPIKTVAYCANCHPNGVKSDSLILGDGQTMANVLVYVKNGLGKRKFDVPTSAETLDQVGCLYSPHVLVVRANQPVVIRNSDDLMHNINGSPKLSEPFNYGQSGKGVENVVKFGVPELSVPVQCNAHPWMKAFVHVMGHPFYSLTKQDGAYSISGLPPGEYEVHAIHERFHNAPLIAQITVEAKGQVKQNFTFKGGEKK